MRDTKCDSMIRVRVPSELIERIKKAARKARRSYSEFVRITLEDAANADN